MLKGTQARPIFKRLLEGMETYAEAVTSIAKQFRADYAAAAKYAAQYKDETRILADKRTRLASKAREDITKQGADLGKIVEKCAADLAECVQDHLAHPVPAATEKLLSMYSMYKLPLSRSEVENLLTVNDGHILGLRFINAMLQDTGSPYKVDFVPLETYEKDIEDLRKFATLAEYTPAFSVDYLPEAVLIFGEQKKTEVLPKQAAPGRNSYDNAGDTVRVNELNKAAPVYRIVNGVATETGEKMNFAFLNSASAEYGQLNERITGNEKKNIPGMAQYWTADIGHTVDDIGYKDDVTPAPVSGTKIETSDAYGKAVALENGKETAKHNPAEVQKVLEANSIK